MALAPTTPAPAEIHVPALLPVAGLWIVTPAPILGSVPYVPKKALTDAQDSLRAITADRDAKVAALAESNRALAGCQEANRLNADGLTHLRTVIAETEAREQTWVDRFEAEKARADQAEADLADRSAELSQAERALSLMTQERDTCRTDLAAVTGNRDQMRVNMRALRAERAQLMQEAERLIASLDAADQPMRKLDKAAREQRRAVSRQERESLRAIIKKLAQEPT
jgi:chromosome segregation ATPase